jgi:predicted acetyltransferase
MLASSKRFEYSPPGPLIDQDLELVIPDERWLDAVMAAQDHPLTRELMPAVAQIPRERHVEFLSKLTAGFQPADADAGHVPAFHFWMRRRDATAAELPIAGGIGMRIGYDENLERVIGHVGYQVYPFARGRHYAERACRLLLPLARQHRLDPLWITCNPDNLASRRTCERLGATLIDVVPIPQDHPLHAKGEREKCRYRM